MLKKESVMLMLDISKRPQLLTKFVFLVKASFIVSVDRCLAFVLL